MPVIACHLGALAGAWIYYLAVELNWPEETEENYDSVGAGSEEAGHYQQCRGAHQSSLPGHQKM